MSRLNEEVSNRLGLASWGNCLVVSRLEKEDDLPGRHRTATYQRDKLEAYLPA